MRESENIFFGMVRNPPERRKLAIVPILSRDIFPCIIPGTSLRQVFLQCSSYLDHRIALRKSWPARLMSSYKDVHV